MMELGTDIKLYQRKSMAQNKNKAKFKFQLDRKSLEIIYTSFIMPILECGKEIRDKCTQYEKDDLEKIQTEAARIAAGTTKLVSKRNRVGHIRHEKKKILPSYKIAHNLTPHCLASYTFCCY